MKALVSLLALFIVQSANAEVPFYVCGFGDIEKIAVLDMETKVLKEAPLAPSEEKYLKSAIDDNWDCDEGVELLGAEIVKVFGTEAVSYSARCFKDSLGEKTVGLFLTCEDDRIK